MFSKRVFRIVTIVMSVVCAVDVAESRTFDRIIAYVNDEVITNWELENLVKQRALELTQIHRFSEREATEKAKQERPDLLDRLIRQMLLVETALTLKVEVTNQELEMYIQAFKDRAQIKTEAEFIKQLKTEGFTLAAFRKQSKRNLMAERLLEVRIFPKLQVRDSDVVTFFEGNRDQFTTKSDNVKLSHILIAFKPTEVDQQAALERANAAFQEAKEGADFEALGKRYSERIGKKSNAGALIELPPNEIEKLSKPFRTALSTLAAGEVSEPIEDNHEIYIFKVERKTDQTVEFRYLIIRPEVSEGTTELGQERAELVYQKLNQGEDFNTLATQYSDDTETREKGGDLGSRSLNELTPETRKIVEGLDAGQYHKPVKMKYGFHIVKVDSRTPPELSDIEKNQIRSILRQRKFEEEWNSYTDMLLENAYVKIKPLE